MNTARLNEEIKTGTWRWPLDLDAYNRDPRLSGAEQVELDELMARIESANHHWPPHAKTNLHRLLQPLYDTLAATSITKTTQSSVMTIMLREMQQRHSAFWAWTWNEWLEILSCDRPTFQHRYHVSAESRQHVMVISYLLGGFTDFQSLGQFDRRSLAIKIFGQTLVDTAVQRVSNELLGWGYGMYRATWYIGHALCLTLLVNRSPYLEDLTIEVLDQVRQGNASDYLKSGVFSIARVLTHLGIIPRSLLPAIQEGERFGNHDAQADVPSAWLSWCQRWRDTSTLSQRSRTGVYYQLLKVGRWLAKNRPDALAPENWTRELAVEYVAAVDRMKVGEWARAEKMHPDKIGKPLSARAKAQQLNAIRTFFVDGQDWGWFPRCFDVRRYLATPRSVRALIAPDPRTIADDVWAKLLWAGLNLTEDDLPRSMYRQSTEGRKREAWYPLKMVLAMVVVWLFAGLRSDEISRLRVGCIRWQREDVLIPSSDEVLPKDAVCWLDVPIHKTGTSFTKAVDPVVGEAVTRWEQIRPVQPIAVDPKTGELVDLLFSYRGRHIGKTYLNHSLIPMLCSKGGIPTQDARGDITSHRARSTIASQLYNAKEPLSLFDLQEWLGHRLLSSTQAYAKKSPTKVAKAYEKAGYFGRNLRTIEVLIDQEVIKSGRASAGEPWRFYDLGHGYCTYEFFDQCPHRMACARCSFYRPKGSTQTQLLEGKANLLHMREEIPLSEEERAAVEDGIEAMEKLCQQLANVPTPAGPTPNQLVMVGSDAQGMIPVEQVRRKRQSK